LERRRGKEEEEVGDGGGGRGGGRRGGGRRGGGVEQENLKWDLFWR
jgi:hypothetical protein